MVLGDDLDDLEEHAAMLQNKGLIQNNVITRRKEQLKDWENSEMNQASARRGPDHKSRVKFQDRDIFLSACVSGDEEEVEGLLKKGSDINVASIDGVTALHQAVIDSNMDMVQFLVKHGANINAQDNEGWTPLHAAVCCGNLNIAKYLCENGSDLSCVNSDKELPVDLAESDEMRQYLEQEMRKKGVDELKAREREFHTMLEDCNKWIQSGCYMDQPHPRTGATALHVAASKGYNKLIGILVRAGADVNVQDFEGWTPLHAAAHWGEKDACRILMENGASLETLTHTGHSVLAVADKSIANYLLSQQEKYDQLRSDAIQQQQQNGASNGGILQDASNLRKEVEKDERVDTPPGLHGAEKLQSAAIRRISSGEKLAIKRKDELDENMAVSSEKRSTLPPIPAERESLAKRDMPAMNGTATTNGQMVQNGKQKDEENMEEEDEEVNEEEEESEWTEVTATPSSSSSENPPPPFTNKAQSLSSVAEFKPIVGKKDETPLAEALVKLPPREGSSEGTGSSPCSLSAETVSTSTTGKSATTESGSSATTKKSSTSRSSSTEQSHSGSPYSRSSDRSNTASGVSSIHSTSRSVTPKEDSSGLYSSDQNIQCTIPAPHSSSASVSSSSTANNNHSTSRQITPSKANVLRAAETVQRLRQQFPQVREKSQSVDHGKSNASNSSTDYPKSPPASAPPINSVRNFWNSIHTRAQQQTHQNHPFGQQQPSVVQRQNQMAEKQKNKSSGAPEQNNRHFMFPDGNRPPPPAPLARITSPSGTSESPSCSSVTPSPSPSPVVAANSPFVTFRKQSMQQSTPPTQPTSQKESEAERKAKSKFKRNTRRSTQGVTLDQLGQGSGRSHQLSQQHHETSEERIRRANERFNEQMSKPPMVDQSRPYPQMTSLLSPSSSTSSSSAYLTASNRGTAPQSKLNQEEQRKALLPTTQLTSTASLIDELEKYKALFERERDENDRLRRQVQDLSAEASSAASNTLRGVGWKPQQQQLQETYIATMNNPRSVGEKILNANGIDEHERRMFERRIAALEYELEKNKQLQKDNDKLKDENIALVRVLAKLSK